MRLQIIAQQFQNSIQALICLMVLYFLFLAPSSLVAAIDTPIPCEQIEAIIDSIFEYNHEETAQTRKLTPYLYQQVLDQKCDIKSKILTLAGIIYYNDGQFIQSKAALEEAESHLPESGCENRICVFTKLIKGLIEMKEKNPDQALLLFKQAGDISRSIDFYSGQLQSLINHALVYNQENDLEAAKKYLFSASELIEKCESKEITGYVFLNLGHTYQKEKKYKEAYDYYSKADDIWRKIPFGKGLFYLENNLAIHAKEQGNLLGYEKHLLEAMHIMEKDSTISHSMSYLRLGYFYVEQGKEKEALKYLQKAISVSDGHDDKEFLDLATELINLYAGRNNTSKIKELTAKIEDIYTAKLARLDSDASKWNEKEFVLESKILENQELVKLHEAEAYKVRIRNILLGLMTMSFLLGAFLFFVWLKSRRLKEELRLEQLRSKISKDLHDDVGTILAGISFQSQLLESSVRSEHASKIQSITKKSGQAITKMRDMIWAVDARNSSPIDLEYKMKDYVSTTLEGSNIDCTFKNTISKNFKPLSLEVKHALYLVFKESIYNILKHSDGDRVQILLSNRKNILHIQIADNGSEKTLSKAGQGLKNMQERMETIGGTYAFTYDKGYRTDLVVEV